jgi:hypothetical protein
MKTPPSRKSAGKVGHPAHCRGLGDRHLARYRLMMKTPAQAELGRGTRQVYASLGVTRKSRSFASLRMTILVSPSSRKGREKWARRGRENPQPPAKSAGRVGHPAHCRGLGDRRLGAVPIDDENPRPSGAWTGHPASVPVFPLYQATDFASRAAASATCVSSKASNSFSETANGSKSLTAC